MAQNLFINLVSIGTLSLALLILSSFILINSNIQRIVESATQDMSVSIYLNDGLDQKAIGRLNGVLSKFPQTAKLSYISKTDAMEDLKTRLGSQSVLLEGLPENPLPSSFELTLKPEFKKRKQIKELIATLEKLKGVSDVDYAWEWAEKISGLLNFLKLSGLMIGGLLFLATVFIISNTIKLTVFSRQDELSIMLLIGATKTFTRMPFYIEGFLQGLVGGVLALLFLFLVFTFIISNLSLPFGLSLISLSFLSPTAALGMVGAGVFMGLLGSTVSLGRFTR